MSEHGMDFRAEREQHEARVKRIDRARSDWLRRVLTEAAIYHPETFDRAAAYADRFAAASDAVTAQLRALAKCDFTTDCSATEHHRSCRSQAEVTP